MTARRAHHVRGGQARVDRRPVLGAGAVERDRVGVQRGRSRLVERSGRGDEHVIDLVKYTYSWPAILKRVKSNKTMIPRWMNVVRAVSSEGFGRIKYHGEVRRRLDTDRPFRRYFEQETTELPQFYMDLARRDMGPLWDWLPEGAMHHDPNAYLKSATG